MAATIEWLIDPPCAGGDHFRVRSRVTIDGTPRVLEITGDRSVFRSLPSDQEMESCLLQLFKVMVRQLSGQSAAQIKTAIEAKTIDCGVTG